MPHQKCEICKQDVPFNGDHVQCNRKFWHTACFVAQKQIDEYYAKWQECAERLRIKG